MHHLRRFVRLIMLALVVTPIGLAQEDRDRDPVDTSGLIIEGSVGIDGVVDPTDPMPISFLLTNNSQKIIEGSLYLSNPIGRDEMFLGEVTLAPVTTRRFATIRNLDEWYECFAELRVGNQVLWRRE